MRSLVGGENSITHFTIILAPDSSATAYLYLNNTTPIKIAKDKLAKLRGNLPAIEFIHSDVPLEDQIPLDDLLASMGKPSQGRDSFYGFDVGQAAADFLSTLTTSLINNNQQHTVSAEAAKKIEELRKRISSDGSNSQKDKSNERRLEGILFRDILDVDVSTLEYIARLPESKRSYADAIVGKWNDELVTKLNLSHYWQQDDQFQLKINYKRRILYFEITDRTGAVYTFRERSSGLKYFLSYYIQAKALELKAKQKYCIILMDEPDSFLSIAGQRNLLAVFESLVRSETSKRNTQLVYTTHSPFLINRNFLQRIRLVRKGDAEEGTQYVNMVNIRRYETVRSALGIDCAQTLFMGATNILFEGPSDQYLVSELVRAFATPENVSEFLDLNSLVLVSADNAPMVEKILESSQWGDEPVPATVVVLDNDDAGRTVRDKISGQLHNSKTKKLIEPEFCVLISDLVDNASTVEDLIPNRMYANAVGNYIKRWFPSEYENSDEAIDFALASEILDSKDWLLRPRSYSDHG